MSKKVDLRAQALAMVKESATVNTSRGERKTMFHTLLLDKELDRTSVIGEIAFNVWEKENPNATDIDPKSFSKITDSVKGSVANFCSKSKRKSTATATYNWDPAYAEFELFKLPGGKLTITKRVNEFETFE